MSPCPFCEAPCAPDDACCASCGRRLVVCEHWRLEAKLGAGGMGTVFGARHLRERREAAVKLIEAGHGTTWQGYDLFRRGSEVLRGLSHAALPKVFAFEEGPSGELVLVRERLDGGTLAERVHAGRRIAPADFVHLTRRLLGLCAYLHGQSPPVLHRDIKPANLMFRTQGDWDAVLVDFDTVTSPAVASGNTLVCSPGYTAPEQIAGDPSPASDLYSLGTSLVHLATGTEPDALPRQGGRLVLGDRLDHLEPELRRLLLALVEPDRQRRPASAQAAIAVLSGKEARPQQSSGKAGKPPRKAEEDTPEEDDIELQELFELERESERSRTPGRKADRPAAPAPAGALGDLVAAGQAEQDKAALAARSAKEKAGREAQAEALVRAMSATTAIGVFGGWVGAAVVGGLLWGLGIIAFQAKTHPGFKDSDPVIVWAACGAVGAVLVGLWIAAIPARKRGWARALAWVEGLPFQVVRLIEGLGGAAIGAFTFRLRVDFEGTVPDVAIVRAALTGAGLQRRDLTVAPSGRASILISASFESTNKKSAQLRPSPRETYLWLRGVVDRVLVPLHTQYPITRIRLGFE